MSKSFQVGDKVKIVKKVTERTPDFNNSWVHQMDAEIGSIRTISRITEYGIKFSDSGFYYPPKSLVKVGFSDFDEVHSYLKRGGYVVSKAVCYRLKNGVLEINNLTLTSDWLKSYFSIKELLLGKVVLVTELTKRKYYVHS